jgi:hypothetical protein
LPESQSSPAPKPIDHSYWVVEGRFLAGEYPRHLDGPDEFAKLESLEAAGVSLYVDLTEEGELYPYSDRLESAEHSRLSIRDVSVPRNPRRTTAILDAIDHHLKSDSKGIVYLHCWGGVGRTGTIVGCWLARHGYPGEKALDRLAELWSQCPKSAWKGSPSTKEQRDYIRDWRE